MGKVSLFLYGTRSNPDLAILPDVALNNVKCGYGKSLSKKILEDLKTHAAICSEEPIRSLYLQDIRCSSASVANELWETVIDCADSD